MVIYSIKLNGDLCTFDLYNIFIFLQNKKMVVNFPCYVKTQEVLSLDELVFEIKEGNLVEAVLPNRTLKYQWEFLVFDDGEDKRAVIPARMSKDKLKSWIEGLLPVESAEERKDRLRWERENELRAASIDESYF